MLKDKIIYLIAFWLLCLAVPATATSFGMNARNLDFITTEMIAEMKKRNLIASVRVNLTASTNVANGLAKAKLIREAGGTVTGIILGIQQDDATCSTNLAALETAAYNEAFTIINNFKDGIQDFEFLNEATHRTWRVAEVGTNTGQTAADYQGKPCYAALLAGLKGMSNALIAVRTASGIPLRSIVGTTGRDWGYISFVIAGGVSVDVVGYHVYPGNSQTTLDIDTWYNYGTGTMLTAFAQFNKPVHINEFNCQEHYLGFDDIAGSANTIACNNALKKHIIPLLAQTTANIEYITLYEFLNDGSKANPEDRFGLMYTILRPKLQLATVSALAGGYLTPQEKTSLISGGYLTCKDLLFYRDRARYYPMTITLSNPVYKSAVNLATTCQ